MSDWGWMGVLGLSVGCWGWVWWQLRKTQGHVRKIMEVLAAASPELERRVLEQGTRVVLNRQSTWRDIEEGEER